MKNIFFISSLFSFLVTLTGAQKIAREVHHSQEQECHTELNTVWENKYVEKEEERCRTVDEEWCTDVCKPHESKECKKHKEEKCEWEKHTECKDEHKECKKHKEEKCTWEKHTECKDEEKTIHIPYKETKCETRKKKVCEYGWKNNGSDKVWAEIPSTCKFEDEEECKDVGEDKHKTREKKIKEKVCEEVPKKKCKDEEIELCTTKVCKQVPKKKCKHEELKLCTTKTTEKCEQECMKRPEQKCEKRQTKIPVRVSKKVPQLVCKNITVPAAPANTVVPIVVVPTFPAAIPAAPSNTVVSTIPAAVPAVPSNTIVKDPSHRYAPGVCRNYRGDQVPCRRIAGK